MIRIKQRSGYPQTMVAAVQREAKKALTRKNRDVNASQRLADEFNISHSTVCIWRRQAKANEAQPAGLAAHQAAAAKIKQYNTPTLINLNSKSEKVTPNTATHIAFQGTNYKI